MQIVFVDYGSLSFIFNGSMMDSYWMSGQRCFSWPARENLLQAMTDESSELQGGLQNGKRGATAGQDISQRPSQSLTARPWKVTGTQ